MCARPRRGAGQAGRSPDEPPGKIQVRSQPCFVPSPLAEGRRRARARSAQATPGNHLRPAAPRAQHLQPGAGQEFSPVPGVAALPAHRDHLRPARHVEQRDATGGAGQVHARPAHRADCAVLIRGRSLGPAAQSHAHRATRAKNPTSIQSRPRREELQTHRGAVLQTRVHARPPVWVGAGACAAGVAACATSRHRGRRRAPACAEWVWVRASGVRSAARSHSHAHGGATDGGVEGEVWLGQTPPRAGPPAREHPAQSPLPPALREQRHRARHRRGAAAEHRVGE